jgi:hypothetical protein
MKRYGIAIEALQGSNLSWRAVLWGLENGLLGWSDVVNLAKHRAGETSPHARELALMGKSQANEVGKTLSALAAQDPPHSEAEIRKAWLRLVMKWIFENRSSYSDPLGEVELVYADFGYPPEIENLVRYMPPADEYDPGKHSATENKARLIELWRRYVGGS